MAYRYFKEKKRPMKMTIDTNLGANGTVFTVPFKSSGIYKCTVDWGDGNSDFITTWNQAETTHNYAGHGVYQIQITGFANEIYFQGHLSESPKLVTIDQWGATAFTFINFRLCSNMTGNWSDTPKLIGSCSRMFEGCTSFNSPLNDWDMKNVDGMEIMFKNCTSFNQPLSNWGNARTGNNHANMFENCSIFNQDLSNWDMSESINTASMFIGCAAFNNGGSALINNWDTGSVTTMLSMFNGATSFNQPIGSWDVSGVSNFSGMFRTASVFNQNLGAWTTTSASIMNTMFFSATAFDNLGSDTIGGWDMVGVTDASNMFTNAVNFNRDISTWNTSTIQLMNRMFSGTSSFNIDIGGWNVSSATTFNNMFNATTLFNQDLGGWDIQSLTDATNMFISTSLSTANYDLLLIGWDANTHNNNVPLGVAGVNYTIATSGTEHANLIGDGWTITDGGGI